MANSFTLLTDLKAGFCSNTAQSTLIQGTFSANHSVKSIPIELISQVAVTEVLGGGRFYVQSVGDQKLSSIQNLLSTMCVKDAPILASFNPKRGDIVLAQFFLENTGTVQCAIRPVDPPVSLAPGHAQLWRLAYIKVPSLKEDFGPEEGKKKKKTHGGQVKGQGTGTEIAVTLIAVDNEISVNFAMLLLKYPNY
ncbi:unnamed protein product [Brassica oleracea]